MRYDSMKRTYLLGYTLLSSLAQILKISLKWVGVNVEILRMISGKSVITRTHTRGI